MRASNEKAGPGTCFCLFDLGFLELDMLAHDGVIFLGHIFLRHGAGVFLCDVEVARASCAFELDLDRSRLRHGAKSLSFRGLVPSPRMMFAQSSDVRIGRESTQASREVNPARAKGLGLPAVSAGDASARGRKPHRAG